MKLLKPLIAAAAALCLTGIALPALAQNEIKISHQWKQGTDGRDRAVRVFVEEVNKADPSLKFRIYPNSSLIAKATAQVDAIQDGSLEMAVYPLVYANGKVPEFSITLMPGTVKSMDHAMRLKNSAFHKKLQEISEANGIHIVTWWWTPGGFATKDRVITGPDSVKGLKMRAADPYMEEILRAQGASIQSMASTEIYPAMQSGVLDGLMTSAESFVSMRIYEQTKNATVGGEYSLFILLQPLIMSKQHWDKLTPKQKEIFEQAAIVSEKFFNDGLQKEAAEKMVETFTKNGNTVRPMTKAEYDAWVAKAKEIAWPKFVKDAKQGQELLTLIQQVQ